MTAGNFDAILPLLRANQVRFIVIGGGAAIVHGSSRFTSDVDLVYARDHENLLHLVEALKPHRPYPRGAPAGLPFFWDEQTLKNGLNFTLTTALGDLDLLGEVVGGGAYEQLLPFTEEYEVVGIKCRFVSLETLIVLKRAAGRPKDLDAIAELENLMRERDKLAEGDQE